MSNFGEHLGQRTLNRLLVDSHLLLLPTPADALEED
jgi:hypothetical protein